jgi:hypothetical protein
MAFVGTCLKESERSTNALLILVKLAGGVLALCLLMWTPHTGRAILTYVILLVLLIVVVIVLSRAERTRSD